ncbi:hypothetical protein [Octadecabacter sp. R77987]|uniref:hypothetical protein n=1 Tax=Octadecabacter sp. R77987 TaxID=3093874 RepID=UPI00366F0B26
MDSYIAEMDDTNRIAAVWVTTKTARGPSVFDLGKHIFDPRQPAEFSGAPQKRDSQVAGCQQPEKLAFSCDAADRKPAGIAADQ